jgi:hypothetical protein
MSSPPLAPGGSIVRGSRRSPAPGRPPRMPRFAVLSNDNVGRNWSLDHLLPQSAGAICRHRIEGLVMIVTHRRAPCRPRRRAVLPERCGRPDPPADLEPVDLRQRGRGRSDRGQLDASRRRGPGSEASLERMAAELSLTIVAARSLAARRDATIPTAPPRGRLHHANGARHGSPAADRRAAWLPSPSLLLAAFTVAPATPPIATARRAGKRPATARPWRAVIGRGQSDQRDANPPGRAERSYRTTSGTRRETTTRRVAASLALSTECRIISSRGTWALAADAGSAASRSSARRWAAGPPRLRTTSLAGGVLLATADASVDGARNDIRPSTSCSTRISGYSLGRHSRALAVTRPRQTPP